MFILTSLDSLNLDIDDLPATKEELTDEHYRLIFDSIKSAYEDNANDDEATLYELIYEDTPICTLFYAPNYTAYSNNLNGLYWDSDTACYYSSAWLSE